jgi:hypothetical protein
MVCGTVWVVGEVRQAYRGALVGAQLRRWDIKQVRPVYEHSGQQFWKMLEVVCRQFQKSGNSFGD